MSERRCDPLAVFDKDSSAPVQFNWHLSRFWSRTVTTLLQPSVNLILLSMNSRNYNESVLDSDNSNNGMT